MPANPSAGHSRNVFRGKNNVELSVTLAEKSSSNERFCSFELILHPDGREETYQQLFSVLDQCNPLFYSITWHNVDNVSVENHPSLKLFEKCSNITLLHLTAKGSTRGTVMHVLNRALTVGKTNIFALQGDHDKLGVESTATDFSYAVDLVKFIRAEFGSKFSICVAGYPDMHPKSPSKESDLFYLKEKVNAGADFIITQIIFESQVFIKFVKDCRRIGISIPIIPGVFLIPDSKSLHNVSKNCDAKIPDNLLQDLELIKDDDAAVQEYGMKLSTRVVKEIFQSGTAVGIHVFTLNRPKLALEFCKRLRFCRV
ncbi:methylenetetrahydrofolate reductase (NADPH) [Neodiprion pinetum]|uniref:methylenetetrahydrofolate reductase (NADPH) n=1 Tax=Neodiprion pinetum TaxID=441929 RepID=UPI001EDE8411|nr:methylenetetrahydrofolate reductase [Neodiprion pinetum]XP_046480707.1 methylenetetrahydrofolate reductase [Neodiprion pinetum]